MTWVRQLLIGLASGSAFYSGLVPALGLGEITLHSALNQPLEAEIELLEVADLSADDLRVRLAPAEVFSRAGVDRLAFLNDLRFTLLLRGGNSVIRVVSNQPVREPYLNFIVEVARPNGQLLREYTLLLDPPNSSTYRAVAQAPAAQARPDRPLVDVSPTVPAAPSVMPAAKLDKRYRVSSGDSLWTIAARLRALGSQASQQALMRDIQALNPQAFANGDINRLRAGADLLLPDVAAAAPDNRPVSEAPNAVASEPPLMPPEQPHDPQAELIAQVQRRVEQELADQAAENLQLQQGIADLQAQLQQLQAQVSGKDQQLAALQAELVARQTPAEPLQAPAPAKVAEPAAAELNEPAVVHLSNWISVGLAMLALSLVGLLGLFWRSKRQAARPSLESQAASVSAAVSSEFLAPPLNANTFVRVDEVSTAASIRPATLTDTLEGANIYIAYGRFSEAAATLRNALVAQPHRSDIRFRLLEVLAQLGDARAFLQEEAILRDSGFTAEPIEQLKTRHPGLLGGAAADPLDEAALDLDEAPPQPSADGLTDDDFQLNLDDLSLDPDRDLVSPFSPSARNKTTAAPAQAQIDSNRKEQSQVFGLTGERDALGPFAKSMLVEETSAEGWFQGELHEAFLNQPRAEGNALLSDLDHLAGSRDNLAKFNLALAYIEQGHLESACSILNELIDAGDDEQRQEAYELLAKIA
ncbi:FimV/HubP family polar landmark protein [Pseudomonas sp. 2FG]|uniref:FimV/HubP family polar landmark protein n=1 Tax=Pseudomonas sp. 2FG TaxID=2502191 RepID=UPI001485B566|nr:FimV/HubP family polar landmark protein [Pseudomonas sp. 2FG]